MDDLDDLLAGGDGFRHRLAGGLVLDRLDEVSGDRQRDVGFEKRHAHLAQRRLDVLGRQGALLRQPVEDAAKAF